MKFSIYSEIQYWGGKSHKRLYEEVIDQAVHADRLGYDCYSIIEHPFFPKFSISTNPFALFAGRRADKTITSAPSATCCRTTTRCASPRRSPSWTRSSTAATSPG